MGWLSNKVASWSVNTQRKELDAFVHNLKGMDGEELGFAIAMATDMRHSLRAAVGWDLLDPVAVEREDAYAAMTVNKLIRQYQGEGKQISAASAMVWLHTLRAANILELRVSGREMWRQLQRGFPHCEQAALSAMSVTGKLPDISGYYQFPIGLTPDPL